MAVGEQAGSESGFHKQNQNERPKLVNLECRKLHKFKDPLQVHPFPGKPSVTLSLVPKENDKGKS